MNSKHWLIIAVMGSLSLIAIGSPKQKSGGPGLEGTWILTFEDSPDSPKLPPAQPRKAMAIFGTDGSVTLQANWTGPAQMLSTQGAGRWKQLASGEYLMNFISLAASVDAQGNGTDAGMVKSKLLIRFLQSNDVLVGKGKWSMHSADGKLQFETGSQARFERMRLNEVNQLTTFP